MNKYTKNSICEDTNAELLSEIEISTVKRFQVNSIDELRFNSFDVMYDYVIDRFTNKSKYNIKEIKTDFMYLSFFNVIDVANELKSRVIYCSKILDKSRSQFTNFIKTDKTIKTIVKKMEKETGDSDFADKIVNLFLAAERLANYYEEEIELGSLKNVRIFSKILSDNEVKEKIYEYTKNNDVFKIIPAFIYLFTNESITKETENIEKVYPFFIYFGEVFLDYWYESQDIDCEAIKLNYEIEQLRLMSIKKCTFESLMDNISEKENNFLSSGLDGKIEITKKQNEFINHLVTIGSEKKDTDIFENKKERKGKLFVYYLEEIIIEYSAVDLCKRKQCGNTDGIGLSALYYLLDLFVYCHGYKEEELIKILIEYVDKEFIKNYDHVIDNYNLYTEIENELNNNLIIVVAYDKFDRDLFKKIICLLEYYSNNNLCDDALKLLYKFNDVDNTVINKFKQADNLYQKTKQTDDFLIWNLDQIASMALAIEFIESEGSKYEGYNPLHYIIMSFFNVTNYLKIIQNYPKYNASYEHFVKKFKDENYELPKEEKEFFDKYFSKDTNKENNLFKIKVNNLNYFYHKNGNQFTNYRRTAVFTPEELALIYTSLKAIIDEENTNNKKVSNKEIAIYLRAILRHISDKKRSKFINGFKQDEDEIKKLKINFLNCELEKKQKTIDDNSKTIACLKEKNKSLSENVEKEIKSALKETKNQFKEKESELKDEIKSLKEQLQKLEVKNEFLEKYSQKLEEELTENEEELDNYSLEQVIGDKKIVIISGRFETQRILENKYPNNIRSLNDSSFNRAVLLNADVILYLYNFSSHQMYYKVKSLVDTNSDYFIYCKYNNTELIEKKLAKTIYQLNKRP